MVMDRVPFKGIQENEAIRAILEGPSTETGRSFFVSNLILLRYRRII
jgi:hypothetical protein